MEDNEKLNQNIEGYDIEIRPGAAVVMPYNGTDVFDLYDNIVKSMNEKKEIKSVTSTESFIVEYGTTEVSIDGGVLKIKSDK